MEYSISEAAKLLGISSSTLRYYESKGLLPFQLRKGSGFRVFDDLDINWCQLLGYLKQSGMSIETIKEYVDLYLLGDETMEPRRKIVYEQREKLIKQISALQDAMDMIEFKCWLYDTAIAGGSMQYARELPRDRIPPKILKTIDRMGGFQPFYLKERYLKALKETEKKEALETQEQ